MLGKLFGSNARVQILKTFLLHPDEKYYIRQLARDLKLQVNSIRRELENLEKLGLLEADYATDPDTLNSNSITSKDKELEELKQGKIVNKEVDSVRPAKNESKLAASKQEKKFYKANKDFVLFDEIKALIAKSQVLYEEDFVKSILKLGNTKLLVLTGVFAGIDSPIDILIVGRINKQKFLKLISDLEKELSKDLNYSIMEFNEFKYRRDMADIFLLEILENKKAVIIDEIGL